jgi:hypothetical protein
MSHFRLLAAYAAALMIGAAPVVALDLGIGGSGVTADTGGGAVTGDFNGADSAGGFAVGGDGNVLDFNAGTGNGISENGTLTIGNGAGPLADVERNPGSTTGDVNFGGDGSFAALIDGLLNGGAPATPGTPAIGTPAVPGIGGANPSTNVQINPGSNGTIGSGSNATVAIGSLPAGGGASGTVGIGGTGIGGSGGTGGAGGAGGAGGGSIGGGGGGGGGGITASFAALPATQQQAIVNRCTDVLMRPTFYAADLVALCRFLARLQVQR